MAITLGYSALATAQKNTATLGGPAEWQLPGVIQSSVRCYIDYYTWTGNEAAGDVIRLFTDGITNVLPNGINILGFDFVQTAALTGLTASVGDYNSATRYASASSSFASTTAFTITGLISGIPYIIGTNLSTAAQGVVTNGDNQIILTLGGSFTGSGILSAILRYTGPQG